MLIYRKYLTEPGKERYHSFREDLTHLFRKVNIQVNSRLSVVAKFTLLCSGKAYFARRTSSARKFQQETG